jgi:hypothetical protein
MGLIRTGRSYDEISQIVGVPVGTVKSRMHRARTLLRQELSDLAADHNYRTEHLFARSPSFADPNRGY